MKPSQAKPSARNVARPTPTREGIGGRTWRRCQRAGVTQVMVAAEATKTSKRGSVSVQTVSKVFADVTKSANVIDAARRCLRAVRAAKAMEVA